MRVFSERMEVLLTSEQRRRLERRAQDEHRSVGAIIRDAVDAYTGSIGRSRAAAADSLLALGAPVDDWEVMKAEIEHGAAARTP